MDNILINPITFIKNKDSKYLTMGEFIEQTKDVPDTTIMVVSVGMDEDTNETIASPLVYGVTEFYEPRNSLYGKAYDIDSLSDVTYPDMIKRLNNNQVEQCIVLCSADM